MSHVLELNNNYQFSVSYKTYVLKPHCAVIESISSSRTQLQLRFVLKNKDL